MFNIINWLTEEKNPAVKYRTKTEILGENTDIEADKEKTAAWATKFLPDNWQDTKGLWYTCYLTAIAECGLTRDDISIDTAKIFSCADNFSFGCADFMWLRAVAMLGFGDELKIKGVIENLKSYQLPDGGFLCFQKLKKFDVPPKSCVKSNNIALMCIAECRKRGINTDIEDGLISYFRNHNVFYRTSDLSKLMIDGREGWRTVDIFHPFEVMRTGLHSIVEAFSALGYGKDELLAESWDMLDRKKNENGQIILESTLTKSYLPKEKAGNPGKWATFYALLAEKEKNNI